MKNLTTSNTPVVGQEFGLPLWQLPIAPQVPAGLQRALDSYAQTIAAVGLNVQPGQRVLIQTEVIHRAFALLTARACMQRGAGRVEIDYRDPLLTHSRTELCNEQHTEDLPPWYEQRYNSLVDCRGALLTICGQENPHVFDGLDPQRVAWQRAAMLRARRRFDEEGINQGKVHWCIAAAPTPAWAKKVFPELPNQAANLSLLKAILDATRGHKTDAEQQWHAHDAMLRRRAAMLNDLQITELLFHGPETDLRVKLLPQSRFFGGSNESMRGIRFMANMPTEEVYTTPDFRGTEGYVRITKPVQINGSLVEDLALVFECGRVVAFDARRGKDAFSAYLATDEGASRLGEVALVGIDSPIYRSGVFFYESLFDENAACHIALGDAYTDALDGSAKISKRDFESLGINSSLVHDDLMVSSDRVSVTARIKAGGSIPLLVDGAWVTAS